MPLTDRTLFRHWTRETCRYGDTDRQGHVNNAVFATFVESARTDFLHPPERPLTPGGTEFVIVHLSLDFRGELHWRDGVEIGSVVTRTGTTSMTLAHGLFHGARCVATAESVLVLLDTATRRPLALPAQLREHLTAFTG